MYNINSELIEQHHLKHYSSETPSKVHLLFTHGAGASTSHTFFTQLIPLLIRKGFHVWTFDFAYMVQVLSEKKRRPPPRLPILENEYTALLNSVREIIGSDQLWIGGKSMGGRVACHVANDVAHINHIDGVIALGYPFHPVGKPEKLRLEVLQASLLPVLICQGDRDALGNKSEIYTYTIPANIHLKYMMDGDHSFTPRKSSGRDIIDNLNEVAEAIALFVAT
ncbi:MAG: alpha/beta fold hydrolase [Glaciecola sp.]